MASRKASIIDEKNGHDACESDPFYIPRREPRVIIVVVCVAELLLLASAASIAPGAIDAANHAKGRLCRMPRMLLLPLLAAQAQAQLVEWPQGITTIDGSPAPHPLQGYCGTHKEDRATKELRHAPLACTSSYKQWYADGSRDPSLAACAERCVACRERGGACRFVSYSFDRAGRIPRPHHPNPKP